MWSYVAAAGNPLEHGEHGPILRSNHQNRSRNRTIHDSHVTSCSVTSHHAMACLSYLSIHCHSALSWQHAWNIAHEPTPCDVSHSLDQSTVDERQQRLAVDLRWSQQGFTQAVLWVKGTRVGVVQPQCLHQSSNKTVAVAMDTRRRKTQERIARPEPYTCKP